MSLLSILKLERHIGCISFLFLVMGFCSESMNSLKFLLLHIIYSTATDKSDTCNNSYMRGDHSERILKAEFAL